MDLNQYFYLNEIQSNPSDRIQVYIIQNCDCITIVDCQKKELLKINFAEEKVYFQWLIADQNTKQQSEVLIWLKKKVYNIIGNTQNILCLFNICRVIFVFYSPNEMNNSSLEPNTCNLVVNYIVQDNAYNIDSQGTNFNTENDFQQKIILKQREWVQQIETPQEINIIRKLFQHKNQFLSTIHSITFNGIHFTVFYNQKNCDSIKEILKKQCIEQFGLILEIVKQLLQILDYFEEIKLVHNGLEMKNIYLDQEQKIQIFNFSSAFFEDKQPEKMKAQSIGCIPPECFQNKQLITTKSNIFKLGVMFFIMLFKRNPFGHNSQKRLENNINGKLVEFQIQDLQLPNKINEKIQNMLKSMLNLEPQKRKSPKEYLQDDLFKPKIREQISKHLLQQQLLQQQFDVDIQYNENITIQQLRSIAIKKK